MLLNETSPKFLDPFSPISYYFLFLMTSHNWDMSFFGDCWFYGNKNIHLEIQISSYLFSSLTLFTPGGEGKIPSPKFKTWIKQCVFKREYWQWSLNSSNGLRFMAKSKEKFFIFKRAHPGPLKMIRWQFWKFLKSKKTYFLKKYCTQWKKWRKQTPPPKSPKNGPDWLSQAVLTYFNPIGHGLFYMNFDHFLKWL